MTTVQGNQVSRAQAWLYASVNIPFWVMQAPTFMILPALYAKHAGLDLVGMGAMLTALRLGDAVIDPMIGHLSDQTRSRFGKRKPWILAGAVLGGIGTLFAFHISKDTGYWWFVLSYAAMTLGWSLAETPHTAWINGLSNDYVTRARLSTDRYNAGVIGWAAFLALPFLPMFATTEITPTVTSLAAWVTVALLVLIVPVALWRLPDPNDAPNAARPRLLETLVAIRGNRPFWWFMLQQTIGGIASGLAAGLFYFYLDNYLHIGDKYSVVMFPTLMLSILGGWMWMRWASRMDKHHVIALCFVFGALTNLAMLGIRPGPLAFPLLAGVFLLSSLLVAGGQTMLNALMADIADFGTMKSGHAHDGNYFAALTLLVKGTLAIGAGMGMMIAGWFGFKANGTNDAHAMQGFFFALVWLPLLMNLIAAALAWKFPLDRQRHAVVQKRLARRAARSGMVT